MSEENRRGRPPYPPEVRERAVHMVFDHQGEYSSQWKAIESISAKLSINHETLRQWVRRAETDAGQRPGLTTDRRSGRATIPGAGPEPAVGRRSDLRQDPHRLDLRGVHHRRLLPDDRRLAGLPIAAFRPRHRRVGDGRMEPSTRRR
jgi:transposase-like protein